MTALLARLLAVAILAGIVAAALVVGYRIGLARGRGDEAEGSSPERPSRPRLVPPPKDSDDPTVH